MYFKGTKKLKLYKIVPLNNDILSVERLGMICLKMYIQDRSIKHNLNDYILEQFHNHILIINSFSQYNTNNEQDNYEWCNPYKSPFKRMPDCS